MKTTTLILSLFVILFTSCESTDGIDEQVTSINAYEYVETVQALTEDCIDSAITTTTVDSLTQTDIDGLILMREEEKLARDVYAYFYEVYGLDIFNKISTSEDRHTSSVLYLLETFGIEDPMLAEVGAFSNETLQGLYESLTVEATTVEEALATGAFIEEYDIIDLEELIEATEIEAIKTVYGHLLAGSGNHLRGFVRTLGNYGVSYEPQLISIDKFEEILASGNRRGNHQGQGKGNRQGHRGQQGMQDGNGSGNRHQGGK